MGLIHLLDNYLLDLLLCKFRRGGDKTLKSNLKAGLHGKEERKAWVPLSSGGPWVA